ncbi:uncharacterized protein LOC101850439 [Aplysia californica]|uniref:Uncharacterized protein LOC101850439 n=1 Tax=Aplysia californica TaxID=6500 RepID=A0ABM0K3Z0_APLCA|nr:uncharacterized protein LOC101850439 [Aplysia californica]
MNTAMNKRDKEGSKWSPDSGFYGSRGNSLLSMSLESDHDCKQPKHGLVIKAGVMQGNNVSDVVSATFKDFGNGTQVQKLVDGGQVIGSVKVENLPHSTNSKAQKPAKCKGKIVPTNPKYQILVLNLNNGCKEYRPVVQSDYTVWHLKQILRGVWGTLECQQVLVYGGKTLDECKTLGFYKMQDMFKTNGKVYLTTRFPAG